MSNVITNLQKAFDKQLMAFGTTNSMKVALENIDNTTDARVAYLAGYLLGVDITSADLSVNESALSIYQIDVNYKSHIGSAPVNQMVDLLRTEFAIGKYFSFDNDCFGVDSISVTDLPVSRGWAKKSISLTVSGFTATI